MIDITLVSQLWALSSYPLYETGFSRITEPMGSMCEFARGR